MLTFFGSGVGLLVKIVIVSLLQSMGDERIVLLGRGRSLDLSLILLYRFGVAGLILVLTSIYLVMPRRGRISPPCPRRWYCGCFRRRLVTYLVFLDALGCGRRRWAGCVVDSSALSSAQFLQVRRHAFHRVQHRPLPSQLLPSNKIDQFGMGAEMKDGVLSVTCQGRRSQAPSDLHRLTCCCRI